MEHAQCDELRQWIEESTTQLAPPAGWEPDQEAARARFEGRSYRQSPVRRSLSIGLVAVGIVCILAVAVPLTRVFAQQAGISWHELDQLWYWLTISRNQQLVRLGLLPDEVRSIGLQVVASPGSPEVVSEVTEAARRVGFMPR